MVTHRYSTYSEELNEGIDPPKRAFLIKLSDLLREDLVRRSKHRRLPAASLFRETAALPAGCTEAHVTSLPLVNAVVGDDPSFLSFSYVCPSLSW